MCKSTFASLSCLAQFLTNSSILYNILHKKNKTVDEGIERYLYSFIKINLLNWKSVTTQKMKFSQFTADLVKFTEEILNGKLQFLRSECYLDLILMIAYCRVVNFDICRVIFRSSTLIFPQRIQVLFYNLFAPNIEKKNLLSINFN